MTGRPQDRGRLTDRPAAPGARRHPNPSARPAGRRSTTGSNKQMEIVTWL